MGDAKSPCLLVERIMVAPSGMVLRMSSTMLACFHLACLVMLSVLDER